MKYYTSEEVNNQLIPPELEEEFDRYILGQACPIVDGKTGYYKIDVDGFLISHNITPLNGHDL